MIPWEDSAQGDGFAISMFVILCLSLGAVFLVVFTVIRNSGRQPEPEDLLIEEAWRMANRPKKKKAGGADQAKAQPWEREADWWRGG